MSYWIDARGFPGYEVSSDGEIRNKKTKRILKPYLNRCGGYDRVDICGKHAYVHLIVADSFFIGGIKGRKITHVNKNRRINSIKNLDILNEN